jgi:hypothetical protein
MNKIIIDSLTFWVRCAGSPIMLRNLGLALAAAQLITQVINRKIDPTAPQDIILTMNSIQFAMP